MATFTLTSSVDHFTGNSGENNTFIFTPSTLQSSDTITGIVGGSFIDVLQITDGGTITSDQFSGVTNVDELFLSTSGNNVTLTNGLVAGASGGTFSIFDGGGNDVVDGSGVNNGIALIFFAAGGSDTFKGGSGDDVFVIAASDLTSSDTIVGGAGFDKLLLGTAGTVAASAFANVTGLEPKLSKKI